MVELYEDTLVDLLLEKNGQCLQLGIKKDKKVSKLYMALVGGWLI